MKRGVIVFFFAFLVSITVQAYTSGIAISAVRKSEVVQVFVNGKLYNKTPSNFIRIKSTQGTFHLRVKILDIHTRQRQEIVQTIKISKGFEYYYEIKQEEGKVPKLIQMRRYPIYSRYFLDYGLYTRGQHS
ncbi:hypothetical protein SanaruYs_11550 [Chryseotalea sanaruensis]|uniref:PEGA domain-containing protein n=1 Tax=Chryseotalea sanaruensis TaxID=2482724 RepID=A0A401U7T3_9BACT|nr:hypothetical protein [Chryseotalea sanaruensis]GCC50936.1 hypothetical protein SanaruYs_11550 [Chryseotalea sanaruensis]